MDGKHPLVSLKISCFQLENVLTSCQKLLLFLPQRQLGIVGWTSLEQCSHRVRVSELKLTLSVTLRSREEASPSPPEGKVHLYTCNLNMIWCMLLNCRNDTSEMNKPNISVVCRNVKRQLLILVPELGLSDKFRWRFFTEFSGELFELKVIICPSFIN